MTILCVRGAPPLDVERNPHVACTAADSLDPLRVLQFDLVVLFGSCREETTRDLIRDIHRFWPWQKWILVGSSLTEDDQRRAYAMGAAGVFLSLPEAVHLMRSGAKKKCVQ